MLNLPESFMYPLVQPKMIKLHPYPYNHLRHHVCFLQLELLSQCQVEVLQSQKLEM